MPEPVIRLACEACGARYTQPLGVITEPLADGLVVVAVEVDERAVTDWCAAHRAPYVIPTPVRV